MVVTSRPAALETGVMQERTAAPSRCTVQAPQAPTPQPNFVPVSWKVSRRTQSSGVSGSMSTMRARPFTRKRSFMGYPADLTRFGPRAFLGGVARSSGWLP
jgi:hypothetical protein